MMSSIDLLEAVSSDELLNFFSLVLSPKTRRNHAQGGSPKMADESLIRSLLLEVRRFQNDVGLLSRTLTDQQLKAVMTRISESKLELARPIRLECLRLILGYTQPIKSTWDLSMADAKGLLELTNDEFNTVLTWALLAQEEGALV
jgi:hypothetical protein